MFRYKQAIGLDIEKGFARVVLVRRGLFSVNICESFSVSLPDSLEESVELLQGFFRKKGWLEIPCVIGLRGESLMLRVLACESRDADSIKAVIEEQMNHFTDISSAATVSEYSMAGGARDAGWQIVLGVARIDTVLAQIDLARQVGLNVVDLVPGPVALFNSAAYAAPRTSAPIVCVDVGESSTQVVIGQGHSLYFSRRFIMGVESLGQPENEAQGSLFSSTETGGELGDEFRNAHDRNFLEWLSELKACLTFYRSRFQTVRMAPDRLIVSGRMRFGAECVKAVGDAVGIETTMISDFKSTQSLQGEGALAAALGFALAGVGSDNIRLSLLPSNLREILALQWQMKYWLAAGIAFILAALAVVARLNRDAMNKSEILSEKSSRLSELEDLEGQLDFLRDENRESRRQLHPLRAAVSNALVYRVVLNALTVAKHEDDLITLISDAGSYFKDELVAGGRAGNSDVSDLRTEVPIRRFSKIVVEGYTPLEDLSTVRGMIETLREHELIDEVDLLADDKIRNDLETRERWQELNLARFAIEISMVRQ